MRSNGYGPANYHLKAWSFEASNDGCSWTELDRRENNWDLNYRYATVNFKTPKTPRENFRFFRLREIRMNHAAN